MDQWVYGAESGGRYTAGEGRTQGRTMQTILRGVGVT